LQARSQNNSEERLLAQSFGQSFSMYLKHTY